MAESLHSVDVTLSRSNTTASTHYQVLEEKIS